MGSATDACPPVASNSMRMHDAQTRHGREGPAASWTLLTRTAFVLSATPDVRM